MLGENADAQRKIAELQAALDAMRVELEKTTKQQQVLRSERDTARQERDAYAKLYELVQHELARLKRQLFGRRAEAVDPAQMQLTFAPVLAALERARTGSEADAQSTIDELEKLKRRAKLELREKKKAKAHGRRDLKNVELPIETIVLEPAQRQVAGGELLIKIGEEVSEHIDRRPASLVRVRVIRPKYKLPADSAADIGDVPEGGIVVAELPERPIARSLAGPGLLAHVLVQKFADHIPLHRQEAIYKREGLKLPRSTLSGWVQGCSSLLARVVDAMWEDARAHAPWIGVDATGVLVQHKEQCKRGHFWVVVAGRDHVLYRYTKTQTGEQVASMLAGFSGPMIADASTVYHELYRREPSLIEVGCWAHCRRGYFDALLSDKTRAMVGIGFISMLYAAHTSCINASTGEVDQAKRKALCTPILADFDAWMSAEHQQLDDGAPIKKAINYTRNHATALRRFLDDGRLRLDNNLSEIELRREVVGKKNWLFCGSDEGAHWNTTIVSLIASCARHDVEPWAYLRDVLTLLPSWPQTRLIELAPKFWAQTAQQPDTNRLLASLRLLDRDLIHPTANATSNEPTES